MIRKGGIWRKEIGRQIPVSGAPPPLRQKITVRHLHLGLILVAFIKSHTETHLEIRGIGSDAPRVIL
jgi:hypothetical protein